MARPVLGLNKRHRRSDLTVGEAAERLSGAGLSVSASLLRKLEREGIFKPSERRGEGNYRVFSERDLEQLDLILGLRELGLALPQVREAVRLIARAKESEAAQVYLQYLEETLDRKMTRFRRLKSAVGKLRRQ